MQGMSLIERVMLNYIKTTQNAITKLLVQSTTDKSMSEGD